MTDPIASSPSPSHSLPPPALIRVGPAPLGARRDTRPVFAANLRWLDSAQDRLTAAEVAQQAANHGAVWKVERPTVTDHFALAPAFVPYDDGTPLRDRAKPPGTRSIAALLATLVPPGTTAIFVHDVTLATPFALPVWIAADTPYLDTRPPGDTLWLVVTVIDGRIAPSDTITLAGGGDLLVTEDYATDILADFRSAYPDGAVYTVPARKLAGRDDRTDPLDSLLRRASTAPTWAARLAHQLPWAQHPALTPVKPAPRAWAKPLATVAVLAGAIYLLAFTVPALYREGRLPFLSPPPPPPPAYVPPPPAAVFHEPLPSAWITACLDALTDLYRPILGYTPGQSSCVAAASTAPGSLPGAQPASAADAASTGLPGAPPPPYGRAAIVYTQMVGAKAGHVRDVPMTFAATPASVEATSAGAIQIHEPATMDKFTAHRSLLPPPGQPPRPRGLHALMRAADLRRYLLDLRRTACLAIAVDAPTDAQSALLSPPGAPYAVAPVGRMKVTITTAMAPPNLAPLLDGIPGLTLTTIKRSFDDSASLAAGGSDPSRPTDGKDGKAATSTAPPATGPKPARALPEIVGCDHPNVPSLATWTLEAHAYALQ
ncbi:hypothetical protein [Azospirillum canadense]|uniref:hypothetical protein n=1 Tax=Azospirillum canadense TaxID=403962 RepID=UPI002227AF11|nr:hypothetical protein [Azospirillum canadense]MCW2240355.1 hypothetical protein [Azospirillum canadense]